MSIPAFLENGGEMGALLRAHPWSTTPLGAPHDWPQALRTSVRLMLTTRHPVFILWGPEGLCFYNDAYRQSLGPERHPAAIGRPAHAVWDEIWDVIGPQFSQVMSGGAPTWHENQLLRITRNGRREDMYWTYSYGPIDDADAVTGVGGVLVLCTETTTQVQAQHRAKLEGERLAQLFEQTPTFMALLEGPDHRITLANPGYKKLVGDRPVIGRSFADALPDAVAQGFLKLLDEVRESGRAFSTSGMRYAVQASHDGPIDVRFVDFVFQPIEATDASISGVFVEGVDVTERVAADRALRASEELWRGLFENLQEGLMIVEMVRDSNRRVTDCRFVDMNLAWGTQSGLSRAESRGRTLREVIPGIESIWIEKFARVADTAQPVSFSQVVGDLRRAYDVRAFPLSGERIAVLFVEVSERNRATARQNALLELSDKLRDLLDPEEIAYATAELLARTVGVTRAGYGEVDIAAETITIARDWNAPGSKSLAGVLNFRDYGSYIEDLKRGATVVVGNAFEDPRTRATASALQAIGAVSFVNMPVSERGGLVALLYLNHVTARDWTADELDFLREAAARTRQAIERRRAEQSLRQFAASLEQMVEIRTNALERAQASLRAIFETSYQWQGLLSPSGIVLETNATALAVIDSTLDEVLGKPYWQTPWFARTAGLPDKVKAAVEAAARGATTRMEMSITVPAGVRSYDFSIRPILGGKGEVLAIVPEAVDTTQRQRAEEQLRQAQKMEAVGQLTGGLAHDFNNLLTGIIGSLELLQARVTQGRLSAIEHYVLAAQGAARRAAALTHRLLAFSRRQTLDPKSTDVNRLIADMADLIRRTVGPAIHLDVVEAGSLWPTLIDPNQLENALLNLCINARDAMPSGGRITIETANKWLDERAAQERDLPPGQYVSLCVSDTGTGMTPEVVARAFDPFFTTKPLGEGTGLGLSMIYGFARQSGGQVRIYSELGQGTTMSLYLPRDHAVAEPDLPQANMAGGDVQGAGEVVLVIDDEATIRMLISEVLDEFGYASIEAADGPTGLKVLQSPAKIDLLITDVGLPGGINGRQVADAARLLRPELKILFITGYAENAVLGNGHLDPGMQVLTKPFGMDVLARRVRNLVEG